MIKRQLELKIKDQLTKFPVVAITGPRQSGKTTLAKILSPDYKYFNLEDISTKTLASSDPVSFINSIADKAIIDEIQKLPELLSQIQVKVDESKKMGQFVITGSESLLLSEKISQSLAGRVANNVLLPLSYEELKKSGKELKNIDSQILRGFYPRIYSTNMTFSEFFPEYVNTYVEKDVRSLKNIGSLSLFEKFLQLLAGRAGQLLNLTSLANDVGVSHNTIESWVSVLEASYIIFRLKPYYKNLGKRVIKSPKVYFHDTGLLCYLLNIGSVDILKSHYAMGSIFENLIVNEVNKYIYNNKLRSKLYFYRDSNGNEVDLLIDSGAMILGIEIKASQTYSVDFLKGLRSFDTSNSGSIEFKAFITYRGKHNQEINNIRLRNFVSLHEVLREID
ncbi:ATP-binding protein [Patescibacteria group bacterium]